MKPTWSQVLILELLCVASYGLLYLFPIASFPTTFSKSVYAFHLPSEHNLITYSEYNVFVWYSAALLPSMALTLSLIRHTWGVFFLLLTTFLIFLIVHPQAFSFGSDSMPMAFDTRPNWSVYMATYMPPSATLAVRFIRLNAPRRK